MYSVPQVSFYLMVDHGVYLRASFDGYDICSEYTQYCTYSIWVFCYFQSMSFKFDETFHVEADDSCSYDFVVITGDGDSNRNGN